MEWGTASSVAGDCVAVAHRARAAARKAAVVAGAAAEAANGVFATTLELVDQAEKAKAEADGAMKAVAPPRLVTLVCSECVKKGQLKKGMENAIDSFARFSKDLRDLASSGYTDEKFVEGWTQTNLAKAIDHIAEMLEMTSFECQHILDEAGNEDHLDTFSECDDPSLLEYLHDLETIRNQPLHATSLGEHCAEYGLDIDEILDRSM